MLVAAGSEKIENDDFKRSECSGLFSFAMNEEGGGQCIR
jgi:hypothetical protein